MKPEKVQHSRWFHELADELSDVDGSAVVWLPRPGEFARPLVIPRQRRPADGSVPPPRA